MNFTKVNIRRAIYKVIQQQAQDAHLSTTKYIELLLLSKIDPKIAREISQRNNDV